MTNAFRASTAALLALLLGVSPAFSQAPTPLTPRQQPATPEAVPQDNAPRALSGPLQLTPKKSRPLATERPSTPAAAGTGERARSIVQVEGLLEVDSNSIGTLSLENGGFGTEMWRGTPRNIIERLVPRLPAAQRSPVLRELMRRLLLSAAAMPTAGEAAEPKQGQSLIGSRVALLQSMGAFKDAHALTALLPKRSEDPYLLRLQAEDRLYANDYGSACQIVGDASEFLARPYWQRLLIFCQMLQGDRESAALGAELLAESTGASDTAFAKIVDHLTETSQEPILSLPKPNALHLAAMRTAKVTIPDDAITTINPAILRTIGISPNARLDTRLEAAEMAVGLGALSSDRLAEIYMAEKFEPVELNNALSLAAADRSPRGRALLFQAAQIESVQLARAAVFSKAFEIATEENIYLHTIELYRSLLGGLTPAGELNWFAAEAARALYALERPLPARGWMDILRLAAANDPDSDIQRQRLWYLGYLTDSTIAEGDFNAGLLSWLKAHKSGEETVSFPRAAAGLRLLEALGHVIPDEAWWEVLGSPQRAAGSQGDPAFRNAMLRAADGGRIGEAILLMLVTFGEQQPGIQDIDTVTAAVRTLRKLGMETEAQNLVLEVAATARL